MATKEGSLYSRGESLFSGGPIETVIVIPPDGGWGWVIVAAAFFAQMVTDGSLYTFGLFLEDMASTFHVQTTKVAVVSSVMIGFYNFTGPFACALTNVCGFRTVAVSGSLVAAVAFIATSQWTILWPVFLTHGFLCGLASSMIYVPSVLIIGFYFEKWRALATSIASAGTSVGIVMFPPLIKGALGNTTWRNQFIVLSVLYCLAAVCALLYKPLQPVKIVIAAPKPTPRVTVPLVTPSGDDSFSTGRVSNYHNKSYPTTADIYKDINVLKVEDDELSENSFFIYPSCSKLSICSKKTVTRNVPELDTIREVDSETALGGCLWYKRWLCCLCCFGSPTEGSVRLYPAARPMYRDDIFYGASLSKLREYTTAMSSATSSVPNRPAIDYHLSVTRVATQKDLYQRINFCCSEAVKRTLTTMLDVTILKSPSFFCLALSGFFTVLGMYVPFVYIGQRAIQKGIKPKQAFYLLSGMGFANGVGRILSGIVTSLPHFSALLVSYLMLLCGGIAAILITLWNVYEWQMGSACVYGTSIACLASIRTIIIVDLVHLENLTSALGVTLIFQGAAALMAMPLAAFVIHEWHGNYDAAFYFAGSSITISALLLMPISVIHKKETS